MPRTGGDAGKLGDRYEGIWTGDNLLDLIAGTALEILPEPFGEEAIGIEFWKTLSDGRVEYHSVKRQTTGASWTLYNLVSQGKNGRSILGDLFEKTKVSSNNVSLFVSGTTANELNEICERALRSADAAGFANQLDTSAALYNGFHDYIEPLCQKVGVDPLSTLKRLRVVGITESELIRQNEFKIRLLFYRPDKTSVDATQVRLLLPEIVATRLGQRLGKQTVLDELAKHGFHERDWAVDQHVRTTVAKLNRNYVRHVEAELINKAEIPRPEAKTAFEKLSDERGFVGIVGPAGAGKSCCVAQTLVLVEQANIPFLALRLDIQTNVLTTTDLGDELDLPMSPVGVLTGIAHGGECVLVIDQLDALSFASGRNPNLWDVFEELLWEVQQYPNMHVALACRAFDAENDPRLRRLFEDTKRTHRVDLGPLPEDLVKQIIQNAGIHPDALGPRCIQMLRIPLHLTLYLQGGPAAQGPFNSVQDLYRRYWDRKRILVAQRLVREPKWNEVIETLTAELSKRRTLSAPEDVLDQYARDAQAMASENVLVLENRRYRFFHEGFFDYAFARIFVQRGVLLVDWLTGSEQHLFRRGQVRQILAYQRGRAVDDYLRDLRSVLTAPRVRFHLKKLVLQWLRQLDNPSEEEWEIVSSLWNDTTIGKHVRLVPHDSVGWFDLLDRLGIWQQWLSSTQSSDVDHAVWLLRMTTVMRERSARVAALVAPYRPSGGEWPRRLQNLVGFGECYHSREMFDLLLSLLDDGTLDATFHWNSLHDMPKRKPEWAAELIAHHLDYLQKTALQAGVEDPFSSETNFGHLAVDFISATAEKCPEKFVYYLLPQVTYLIHRTEQHQHGKVYDGIWNFKVLGRHEYGMKDALLGSLVRAMRDLAREVPPILDALTDGLDTLPHETIAFLLENAWTANGSYYADRAVQYLLSDARRLEIGYSMWASGSGQQAVSCALIAAISPHCSDAVYAQLEQAILNRATPWEREHPKSIGITEFHLLNSFISSRLSKPARLRLEELRRKFPEVKIEAPQPLHVVTTVSPIPDDAIEKMTDEQWLSAMAEYAGSKASAVERLFKGDVHELSIKLEIKAKENKERFANLALTMGDDIHPRYFSTIMAAIVAEKGVAEEPQAELVTGEQGVTTRVGPPLGTAEILAVIKRLHALPNKPCGAAICRAVAQIAERSLPDEILEIVSYYAIQDPDPQQDSGETSADGGVPDFGGSWLFHGLNTVRGSAASAIGQLLFGDASRLPKLELAIESLVRDPSLAVRTSAVEILLPILNVDRDRAISLFLELCQNAGAILGTHTVDTFLHYATFRHYGKVRELLRTMLTLDDSAARQSAAGQICIASLHDKEAADDVKLIDAAGEHARAAAAAVYAANLSQPQFSEVCRVHLLVAFNDESKKVREAAVGCFRRISSVQLAREIELVDAFISSAAFVEGANELLLALEASTVQLPDVICRLPERVIELHRLQGSPGPIDVNWWTYMMPPLVLRLYEQTKDPKIQTRCLNLIDSMIDLEFGSIQTELVKVER